MNFQTLKAIADLRHLSQTDLARASGVSRQAVSLWFREAAENKNDIPLRSSHLKQLANELGISLDDLATPLPLHDDPEVVSVLETSLLWDRLYPSLAKLVIAAIENDPRALARVAQVYGLFQGAKMFGKKIWKRFPRYKKYMHPAQRRNWERIWDLQQNPGLI